MDVEKFILVPDLDTLKGHQTCFAENVSIEEKPVLTQTVNLRRYYIFYTNGETTGITELNKANNSGAELYTLQGLRVVAPVKGQVYVKNGKKVIFW